jgi:hypothetical protein
MFCSGNKEIRKDSKEDNPSMMQTKLSPLNLSLLTVPMQYMVMVSPTD